MEIILIGLVTVLASGIGTLTGFGTSTILVPILALFYSLPVTLLVVGIIHWFGDIWKIILFKKGINRLFLIYFGITGIAATFIGARLVLGLKEDTLSKVIGVFLLFYVSYLVIKPAFKLKKEKGTALTGGALYGFSAGIFGIGGAVRGAFLSAFDLPKEVYIATAGAIGLVVDSVRVGTYFWQGTRLPWSLLIGLVFFIPASLIGAQLAKRYVKKIPQKNFRKVIAVFLAMAALVIIFR